MRTLLLAAVALPVVALLQAAPANATWTCQGPEYVCGASSSAKESRHGYRYAPAAKKKAVRHYGSKRKSAARAPAYSRSASRAHRRSARLDRARAHRAYRPSRERTARAYRGGSSYQSGLASYYWQGQRVASGGRFNPNGMTAAHRTLPFGTKVRVTHARTGRSVVVTINDRGPFIKGRVIDLSKGAASALGILSAGVASVQLAVIGR